MHSNENIRSPSYTTLARWLLIFGAGIDGFLLFLNGGNGSIVAPRCCGIMVKILDLLMAIGTSVLAVGVNLAVYVAWGNSIPGKLVDGQYLACPYSIVFYALCF